MSFCGKSGTVNNCNHFRNHADLSLKASIVTGSNRQTASFFAARWRRPTLTTSSGSDSWGDAQAIFETQDGLEGHLGTLGTLGTLGM